MSVYTPWYRGGGSPAREHTLGELLFYVLGSSLLPVQAICQMIHHDSYRATQETRSGMTPVQDMLLNQGPNLRTQQLWYLKEAN